MHDNEEYFFEALRAGASGYVLKSTADRDLVDACRATMRGEPFVYPTVAAAMVAEKLQRLGRGEEVSRDLLTERETQVVKLIAEAYTNEQIAQALVISPKTVERHRANILEKLETRDRVELTRYAMRGASLRREWAPACHMPPIDPGTVRPGRSPGAAAIQTASTASAAATA
jgi:DNA-binding NarL/FixJ family response regulator